MDILHTLFGEGKDLNSLQMVCRAVGCFFITLALIRIAGIRTFGRRTAFDNVITIMLGSIFDTEFGRLMKQPSEIGKAVTQSAYLVVNDADLVYGRALEAGAQIVLDIKDEDYGGRGFTCRDPEGHLWSIGTYDPDEKSTGR